MIERTKRADLIPAATLFAKACKASRLHSVMARRALDLYGDHGSQISGVVRDHFPTHVKTRLRCLAHAVTNYSDSAYKARPKRVRLNTLRELARDVATRNGSGFYGPQSR